MTTFLREYLLSIVAVSLLSTLVQALVPKGGVRSTIQFLCGLLLIMVTIAPITKINVGDIQLTIPNPPALETPVCDPDLARQVAEECQAYVVAEAHTMGYTIGVTVTVNQSTPYPYPESIVMQGALPDYAKKTLAQLISKNLAIPPERQHWG